MTVEGTPEFTWDSQEPLMGPSDKPSKLLPRRQTCPGKVVVNLVRYFTHFEKVKEEVVCNPLIEETKPVHT